MLLQEQIQRLVKKSPYSGSLISGDGHGLTVLRVSQEQLQSPSKCIVSGYPLLTSFSHKWSLNPGRVNAERLLVTFQIEHLAKLGNPAPCARRVGGRRLTSVRGPRDAEGGVEATVEALSGVGQDELLQPRVPQEGVGPVHTHRGQVAVHRQRAAELRRCGRGVSVPRRAKS